MSSDNNQKQSFFAILVNEYVKALKHKENYVSVAENDINTYAGLGFANEFIEEFEKQLGSVPEFFTLEKIPEGDKIKESIQSVLVSEWIYINQSSHEQIEKSRRSGRYGAYVTATVNIQEFAKRGFASEIAEEFIKQSGTVPEFFSFSVGMASIVASLE